jgi:DNA-directed RNA polymerase specialized sigma24 family protein
MDLERQRWAELSRGISAGNEEARQEFCRRYAPGVRAILRRQLGAVGLERLVGETLDGAAMEIEQGKVREPRDLVRFVRNVAARGRGLKMHPKPPPPSLAAPALSPAGRTALRERIQAADKALASFAPLEREMLICYYARGFSRLDIESEFDIPLEEFELLRERLVEALTPDRKRKVPSANPKLLVRHATAGD